MATKLISWNVNGIRSVLGKGFLDFVKKENPDIICLQEIKANKEQVDLKLSQYPFHLWHSAKKQGYSGTAIFSKVKPINVIYGGVLEEGTTEGRVIAAEFEQYYVINVYTPNSQRGLTRLDFRQKWDEEFFKFVKELEKNKPVVFCGDLNVAHREIDLANPKSNHENPGFTDQERAAFSRVVENGFIDTFREFNQQPQQYTWWSYMFNARAKNIGWRIDYFCISKILRDQLEHAFILPEVKGSDHCPVGIVLKEYVQ